MPLFTIVKFAFTRSPLHKKNCHGKARMCPWIWIAGSVSDFL